MSNDPNTSSSRALVIYGPDNRPISLNEQQRTDDLLGSYDSYLSASFALPPFNPDLLLASRGYKLLEDQLHMTCARAPLNIIRSATLYKGWTVQSSISDETDARYQAAADLAAAFRYALENIEDDAGNILDFRHVLYELLAAVHYGFNVTEIHWRYLETGAYAGKLGFRTFSAKPCRQIGFGLDPATMAVQSLTSYTPGTGYTFNLPPEKVLRYTFQPASSLPYGNGIGRVVYKNTWSTDFLMKFWNVALEVFGTPFILGKAPPNSMALARAALAQIRQGAPAVLPSGVEAQLIQVAAGGLSAFKEALQYHRDECALAYLNSTLTTTVSQNGGNRALGQVHQDTTDYGLGYIRTDLENLINLQLVRRWVIYNYGQEFLEIMPRLTLGQWDGVDMSKLASAFKTLIDANVVYEGEAMIRDRMMLPPASPEAQAKLEERRKAGAPQPGDDPIGDDRSDDDDDSDDPDDADDDTHASDE